MMIQATQATPTITAALRARFANMIHRRHNGPSLQPRGPRGEMVTHLRCGNAAGLSRGRIWKINFRIVNQRVKLSFQMRPQLKSTFR